MRPPTARAFFLGCFGAGMCWLLSDACAQTQRRDHIFLPPAFAATPLSTVIEAQAKYVAAYGDFLESVATARKIHAEAFALEIENSVRYVDAYFERREKNREWRRKEEKNNHWDTVQRQEALRKEKVEKYFSEVLKDDPARQLNWLLTELSGPTMAIQYLAGTRSLGEFDQKIPKEDQQQIWLSDGGLRGQKLEVSLAEGSALKTPWPYVLRAPQFDAARDEYETARGNVLKEVQVNGHVSHTGGQQLIKAVSQLLVLLEEAFPGEARAEDPSVFLAYNSAKHYLQSLVGQVNRVCTTNDTAFLSGAARFDGQTVLDLVQYMYQKGLVFAKPHPGGERVYRNLLTNLRNIYVKLGSDKAQEEPAQGRF